MASLITNVGAESLGTEAFATAPENTAPSQAGEEEEEEGSLPLLTPKDDATDPIRTLYETAHSELTNFGKALTCPICQSTYAERTVILPCVHAFCYSCITLALRSKQECPICKTHATKRGLVDCPLLEELTVAFKQVTRSLGWTPSVYSNQVDMTQLPATNSQSVAMVECHEQLQAAKVWQRALNAGQDNPILQEERAKVVKINQEAMVRAAVQKKANATTNEGNKGKGGGHPDIRSAHQKEPEAKGCESQDGSDKLELEKENSQRTANFQESLSPPIEQIKTADEQSPPLTNIVMHRPRSPLRKAKQNNIYTWAADKQSDDTTSLQSKDETVEHIEECNEHNYSTTNENNILTPRAETSQKQQPTSENECVSESSKDASPVENVNDNFDLDDDVQISTNNSINTDESNDELSKNSRKSLNTCPKDADGKTNSKEKRSEYVAIRSANDECSIHNANQSIDFESHQLQVPATDETKTTKIDENHDHIVSDECSDDSKYPLAAVSDERLPATNADTSTDNKNADPTKPNDINDDTTGSTINASGSFLSSGTVVQVQARTWPGINKHGGVGRITRVYNSIGAGCYDVAYVLGGKEKKVDAAFVSRHEDDAAAQLEEEKRSRRGVTNEIPVSLLQALAAEGFEVRRCSPRRTRATHQTPTGGKANDKDGNIAILEKESKLKRKSNGVTTAKKEPNDDSEREKGATARESAKNKRAKNSSSSKTSKPTENNNAQKRKSGAIASAQKKQRKRLGLVRSERCTRLADQYYKTKFEKAIESGVVHAVSSSLSETHEGNLQLLVKLLKKNNVKLRISDTFNAKKTTLVLIPSCASGEARSRTLKAMRASLAGVPIVDPRWIEHCLEKKSLVVPTKDMYIRSLPTKTTNVAVKYGTTLLAAQHQEEIELPLDQMNVHFWECTNDARKDVQVLLREAGATYLPGWEAMTRLLKKKQHVTLLLGNNEKLPISKWKEIEKLAAGSHGDIDDVISIVTTSWLFDSISCGEALPDTHYRVSK